MMNNVNGDMADLGGENLEKLENTVAAIVHHMVKSGSEVEYEAWLKKIEPLVRLFPGYQGREIFHPTQPGTGIYTIILHFDTVEHLKDWLTSDTRQTFMNEVQPFLSQREEVAIEAIETGLESWFTEPTPISAPTPTATPMSARKHVKPYKQFLLILSALYPLMVAVPWLLAPLFVTVPFIGDQYIKSLLEAALIVALLTFVILPRYTRLVAKWLFD